MTPKTTKFMMLCYVLAAVAAAAEGKAMHAFESSMLAIGVTTCNQTWAYVAYSIAAVLLAYESRFLGTLGYVLKATGTYELANPVLALHYGLMSFDAEDEPFASRLANGGLAMSYAL